MTVTSMTGFARYEGLTGGQRFAWEIKTVNGKGLDIRLRLPPGFDGLEPTARQAAAARFSRGNCQIGLAIRRENGAAAVRINRPVLEALIAAMADIAVRIDASAPSLDGILALPGVLETSEPEPGEAERQAFYEALMSGLKQAVAECAAMREAEGRALNKVLSARIDEIEALAGEAEANPVRQPAAIEERLRTQIRAVVEAAPALDPDRLHQEALLIAARVDIREELDRISAHVAAARSLLADGTTVGRRLDFLAQEFNREVNTLCSKANDVSLTATGLALKAVVEQFREQVQNIE